MHKLIMPRMKSSWLKGLSIQQSTPSTLKRAAELKEVFTGFKGKHKTSS